MPELPRLFQKIRFKIPANIRPSVLIDLSHDPFDEVDDMVAAQHVANGENYTLEIRFWKNFWIELPMSRNEDPRRRHLRFGMHCVLDDGKSEFEDIRITVYNHDGYSRGTLVAGDYFGKPLPPNPTNEQIAYDGLAMGLAYQLHYLSLRRKAMVVPGYTPPTDRAEPRYHGIVGDTFRYERVSAHAMAEFVHQRDSKRESHKTDIKKRDHEVVGHWRQYKSGKRVFVRGHRRGDPALGTVTKVYKVE